MAAVDQHPQAVFKKTILASRSDGIHRGSADQGRGVAEARHDSRGMDGGNRGYRRRSDRSVGVVKQRDEVWSGIAARTRESAYRGTSHPAIVGGQ